MITELRHELGDWMEYRKDKAAESDAIASNMRLKLVGALTRQHFEVRTCADSRFRALLTSITGYYEAIWQQTEGI
jgi:hypothetical protein